MAMMTMRIMLMTMMMQITSFRDLMMMVVDDGGDDNDNDDDVDDAGANYLFFGTLRFWF